MEDCRGKSYAEEEEKREGRPQIDDNNRHQYPNNEEWWEGKEYLPTLIENTLCEEDLGRSHEEW
jgi:hypothetical protein